MPWLESSDHINSVTQTISSRGANVSIDKTLKRHPCPEPRTMVMEISCFCTTPSALSPLVLRRTAQPEGFGVFSGGFVSRRGLLTSLSSASEFAAAPESPPLRRSLQQQPAGFGDIFEGIGCASEFRGLVCRVGSCRGCSRQRQSRRRSRFRRRQPVAKDEEKRSPKGR